MVLWNTRVLPTICGSVSNEQFPLHYGTTNGIELISYLWMGILPIEHKYKGAFTLDDLVPRAEHRGIPLHNLYWMKKICRCNHYRDFSFSSSIHGTKSISYFIPALYLLLFRGKERKVEQSLFCFFSSDTQRYGKPRLTVLCKCRQQCQPAW